VRETDEGTLIEVADIWRKKYDWPWQVKNGAFYEDDGHSGIVFRVEPVKAFGVPQGQERAVRSDALAVQVEEKK
jgi:hypothetical protein